jgi:Asp-tRNA(Asn)/Glu-tRNA(Gln) amidotransferase A subunit family amidase
LRTRRFGSSSGSGSSRPLKSATELAAAVAAGECSAVTVVEDTLVRAEKRGDLGIFWTLDRRGAITAAQRIDERIAAGEKVGPLAGVPLAVKDSIDVVGLPTSFGTGGELQPADADAEPVSLARAAGGVPLGKTAMDQLGWTTGGRTHERAALLNPLDETRSPGGSSGGSAAAVAAGIAPLGIGADAAGSIRVPAAYCGVVGLKPATGVIPTEGMKITVEGFDCVGVIAASMRDARLALTVLSGASAGNTGSDSGGASAIKKVSVGRLDDLFEETDAVVAGRCLAALTDFEPPYSVTPTRLDWQPEGLGRALAGGLTRSWGDAIEAAPERYSPMIRSSIKFGRKVDDEALAGLHEKFAAARLRLAERFAPFDVLASPTVPEPVPLADDEDVAVSTRFTRIFNVLDWPAVSLPVGSDEAGMPVGLQLASPPEKLGLLLATAEAVESTVG